MTAIGHGKYDLFVNAKEAKAMVELRLWNGYGQQSVCQYLFSLKSKLAE